MEKKKKKKKKKKKRKEKKLNKIALMKFNEAEHAKESL
jgi:hypothetical protein